MYQLQFTVQQIFPPEMSAPEPEQKDITITIIYLCTAVTAAVHVSY